MDAMNVIKLQGNDGEIVAEIAIDTKNPENTTVQFKDYLKADIRQILYPENMPASNGVLKVLKSQLSTLQEFMGVWTAVRITESKMSKWIKGGFSSVDINTYEYWKARGTSLSEEQYKSVEVQKLIDSYINAIANIKAHDKALKDSGLLFNKLEFRCYCKTMQSLKVKKAPEPTGPAVEAAPSELNSLEDISDALAGPEEEN